MPRAPPPAPLLLLLFLAALAQVRDTHGAPCSACSINAIEPHSDVFLARTLQGLTLTGKDQSLRDRAAAADLCQARGKLLCDRSELPQLEASFEEDPERCGFVGDSDTPHALGEQGGAVACNRTSKGIRSAHCCQPCSPRSLVSMEPKRQEIYAPFDRNAELAGMRVGNVTVVDAPGAAGDRALLFRGNQGPARLVGSRIVPWEESLSVSLRVRSATHTGYAGVDQFLRVDNGIALGTRFPGSNEICVSVEGEAACAEVKTPHRWHAVAVTVGALEGRLRLYIDGDLAAEKTLGERALVEKRALAGKFSMGGYRDGPSYHGWLDDLIAFRAELTSEQVAETSRAYRCQDEKSDQPSTDSGAEQSAPVLSWGELLGLSANASDGNSTAAANTTGAGPLPSRSEPEIKAAEVVAPPLATVEDSSRGALPTAFNGMLSGKHTHSPHSHTPEKTKPVSGGQSLGTAAAAAHQHAPHGHAPHAHNPHRHSPNEKTDVEIKSKHRRKVFSSLARDTARKVLPPVASDANLVADAADGPSLDADSGTNATKAAVAGSDDLRVAYFSKLNQSEAQFLNGNGTALNGLAKTNTSLRAVIQMKHHRPHRHRPHRHRPHRHRPHRHRPHWHRPRLPNVG